jgi:hypothetical protein
MTYCKGGIYLKQKTTDFNHIFEDAKMMTLVVSKNNLPGSVSSCEEMEVEEYLTRLLERVETKKGKIVEVYQSNQMKRNIQSQIQGLKRYKTIK